jgi:anaerobic selenocysteine-containing dehydrogenase
MPTGALADEILVEGEDRVRALLSCGGNPATAWPDQLKALDALSRLELLVQFDPWMSATARLAHYVIAPKMFYEVPGATFTTDITILMQTWYGPAESYAQYTPAVVDPADGSDVVEEWEFFYGLARRLGLQLELSDFVPSRLNPWTFDMRRKPTTDELVEALAAEARVPLEEVKRHPHGATFPGPECIVEDPDPNVKVRLQLAHPDMLGHLKAMYPGALGATRSPEYTGDFPLRLVTRRIQHTYNSTGVEPRVSGGRRYNPAFVHPADLEMLGLSDGDDVTVRSARASIPAVVSVDDSLRRGVVAMSHGFGGAPDRDDEYRTVGSCTSRLLDASDLADPFVGMPRISNIPVSITARQSPSVSPAESAID